MTAPRAVAERLLLFESGCFHGGTSAAGWVSVGGSSCLRPGLLDPVPSSGLTWPLSLEGSMLEPPTTLAPKPLSFLLSWPFLPRILPSRTKLSSSLSIGFFPCSLEAINEHRTARMSSPVHPVLWYTPPCTSLLPLSLCPWQPLGDAGQSGRDAEAPEAWASPLYLPLRPLGISRTQEHPAWSLWIPKLSPEGAF